MQLGTGMQAGNVAHCCLSHAWKLRRPASCSEGREVRGASMGTTFVPSVCQDKRCRSVPCRLDVGHKGREAA